MVSYCYAINTDKKGYELKSHGTISFPLGVYLKDTAEGDVFWHYHDEFELILILRDGVFVGTSSLSASLSSGDAVFINSDELHMVQKSGKGVYLHSLVFAPRLISGGEESVFTRKYVDPFIKRGPKMLVFKKGESIVGPYIEKVYMLNKEQPFGYELESRIALTTIFIELFKKSGNIEETYISEKQKREEERIKKMVSFIQNHADEDIDVDKIAQSANIGRSECLRCFKATLNTSPAKYLSEFRLEKAAKLLEDTDMKIIEIGVECGFADMSYFAKTFFSRFKKTPKEYRYEKLNAAR